MNLKRVRDPWNMYAVHIPTATYTVVSRRRPISSATATPISTSAAAPRSSALEPESPPVFGSVLGARVGVAAPLVVLDVATAVDRVDVAAAVPSVVVAASVASVVVAAAVASVVVAASGASVVVAASGPTAVPVVCSNGAAEVVAPTNGTSSKLKTMTVAIATTTARDVLRIESSFILHKRPVKHTFASSDRSSTAGERLQVPYQHMADHR